ncbi:methyltransferase domain-containing protein [Coprothermobacteraceae bacterium]|nr:methyltransferase domain-containing protein [Coprothermobacteraceae bacterium]
MWTVEDKKLLKPIYERIVRDLLEATPKNLLVLCSARGELACYVAKRLTGVRIVGLELDEQLLEQSVRHAQLQSVSDRVTLLEAQLDRIPFPDEAFDALVSEFIVDPTTTPTSIGQNEMARVLRRGGRLILTDVIAEGLDESDKTALRSIGLEYVCDATVEDFKQWLGRAGFVNVNVEDLSFLVRPIWASRAAKDLVSQNLHAYRLVLGAACSHPSKIIYIYIRCDKG